MSTIQAPAIDPGMRLLRTEDVAKVLRITKRYLCVLRAAGRFPQADAYVGRGPRWKETTVQKWLDAGGCRTTRRARAAK
jgi:predicted DNA-binding transcriptional regulator AlpA